MASSEDDDKDVMRRDWLAHEYTQEWARASAASTENARKLLMAACGTSTDPKVSGAFHKYMELATISAFLKTGGKSGVT